LDLLRDLQRLIALTLGLWLAAFIYVIVDDADVKWYKAPPPVADSGIIISDGDDDFDKVVNGIHVQTGLVYDEGFDIVRAACTACHSAKLVTQNRATEEGSTHYAPEEIGRRQNLDVAAIEWYILEVSD